MISLKVIKPHIISYVVANSYLDSKTYVSFKLKKKRLLTAIHYTNLITSNGGLLNLSPNSLINLNADRESGLSTKETPLFLCIESPMKHGLMGLVVIWWDCDLCPSSLVWAGVTHTMLGQRGYNDYLWLLIIPFLSWLRQVKPWGRYKLAMTESKWGKVEFMNATCMRLCVIRIDHTWY